MSESNGTIKEYYIKPEISRNVVMKGIITAYLEDDTEIDYAEYDSLKDLNESVVEMLCSWGDLISYFQISPHHD